MIQHLDEAVSTCESLLTESQLDVETDPPPDDRALAIAWAEACQSVGNVLTSMGFVEEAYPWRSMAFDAAPNNAKFYSASGRAYCQCKLWDRAVYFCQKSLEYHPDNVSARQRLAKAYSELGERRKESEVVNELLTLDASGATAEKHCMMGQLFAMQGNRAAAVECYERAIAQDAEYAAAYYTLGEIWSQQGLWEKSVALFETLIERSPKAAMAHYQMGRAYRLGQQSEAAIACFRQALKLDPELHWAYMGLLNTLMQMQRWDEVIQICEGITHFAEKFPWLYCFMGNAFAHKEDFQQAAQCHQQAFALKGWQTCADQNYLFVRTWFSENIELWQDYLKPLTEHVADRSPAQILSLGSSDDSILLWLADEILRQSDDRLICITPWVSEQLEQNLAKLLRPEKIVLDVGNLQEKMAALSQQTFDVIVIQSDCKNAGYVRSLATSVWDRLQVGGILFFKDYQWQHPTEPSQSSKHGIDGFMASVVDQIQVLHHAHQVILKKEGASVAQ